MVHKEDDWNMPKRKADWEIFKKKYIYKWRKYNIRGFFFLLPLIDHYIHLSQFKLIQWNKRYFLQEDGKKALLGILIWKHAVQVTIGNNCQSQFWNILIYSQQTGIQIGEKLFPTFKNIKEIASSLIVAIDIPQHKHRANISTEMKQLIEMIMITTTSLHAYFSVCRIDTYVLINEVINVCLKH